MALLGALGCSDAATVIGNACEPEVALTVGATAPPEFTWVPACDVGTVYVTTEAGNPMWQIRSEVQADLTPTNQIRSGVVYSTVPAKAQHFLDPVPLEAGQTYRVVLFVTDSHGDDTRARPTRRRPRAIGALLGRAFSRRVAQDDLASELGADQLAHEDSRVLVGTGATACATGGEAVPMKAASPE
jgi:hypothetical protein